MSCSALKTGEHSPTFELWCLVLSVELVLNIQMIQLQHALLVNDSDIAILLHRQQYQLSELLPMHMTIMATFWEKCTWVAVWFEEGHFADSLSYDSSILKW